MPDAPLVTIGAEGWRCEGARWQPEHPWVGALDLAPEDRRARLLKVAAEARELPLEVVRVEAPAADPAAALAVIATASTTHGPRGLLLGEAWQEAAAARCGSLTGAAADLGLADALRTDDPENWLGHHLEAGALEAFLAQTWSRTAGAPPRAIVLGGRATAQMAALVAALREVPEIVLVVPEPQLREEVTARLGETVNWPPGTSWQVSAEVPFGTAPRGLWLRATSDAVADAVWLPDAAGEEPCVLVDLRGDRGQAPLGFAHPETGGIQVMASGLAAAWYLGPPIPWDALSSTPPS